MAKDLECWEDPSGLCFWIVPLVIFLSFIALGTLCGFCSACCFLVTDDDEVVDAKRKTVQLSKKPNRITCLTSLGETPVSVCDLLHV